MSVNSLDYSIEYGSSHSNAKVSLSSSFTEDDDFVYRGNDSICDSKENINRDVSRSNSQIMQTSERVAFPSSSQSASNHSNRILRSAEVPKTFPDVFKIQDDVQKKKIVEQKSPEQSHGRTSVSRTGPPTSPRISSLKCASPTGVSPTGVSPTGVSGMGSLSPDSSSSYNPLQFVRMDSNPLADNAKQTLDLIQTSRTKKSEDDDDWEAVSFSNITKIVFGTFLTSSHHRFL